MISFLLFSHYKKEILSMKKCSVDVSSRISEDDWKIYDFIDEDLLAEFMNDKPVLDISCVDVTGSGGVYVAQNMRKSNDDMYIIIVSDMSVPPTSYINPAIMAGSLLLRPLTQENMKKVFSEAFSNYLMKFYKEDGTKSFIIDNRDGRQLVPYSQILFFEAREKKIFLNTNGMKYAFYDTLDGLESRLNDSFVRCHRSFIVAKSHIKKIKLSQSVILLDNGYQIPLSRSYKSSIKELK